MNIYKKLWPFILGIVIYFIVLLSLVSFIIFHPDSPYTGIALNGVFGLALGMAGYYVRGKTH